MLKILDANGNIHELDDTIIGVNIKAHLSIGPLEDHGYPGAFLADVREPEIDQPAIDVRHNTSAKIVELEQRAIRAMREIMCGDASQITRLQDFNAQIAAERSKL